MSSQSTRADWNHGNEFHQSFLVTPDADLSNAIRRSADEGLPKIAVGASEGKFLSLIIRAIGAKRVLEVGLLGGYSTIWMAKALPEDGSIVTCEYSEKHAKVAEQNLKDAGLLDKVTIKIGKAADTLKALDPVVPFDFAFIDADSPNTPTYFAEAKRLLRKGGLIVVDNVIRDGRVADLTDTEEGNVGVRQMLQNIKGDSEVDCTTIATALRGYDGFLFALKK